jgi:F0F1-type ATP synthase gamma subunit
MINKKSINTDIALYSGMKNLVETYTEIAAARIQKIRNAVLRNRAFLEEIDKLYEESKYSYLQDLAKIARVDSSAIRLASVTPKNGKTALVFVCANAGLYGDILKKVLQYFLDWANRLRDKTDIVIIGKRGKVMFDECQTGRSYLYFDFPDDSFNAEDFKKLLLKLVDYSDVLVFYGLFESIGSQVATMANVNGNAITVRQEKSIENVNYLFEPSVKEVMIFFETEIFSSLLVQTLHESQLAKYASRMLYLDKASQTIDVKSKKLNLEKLRLQRRISNTKQVETLGGISLWQ